MNLLTVVFMGRSGCGKGTQAKLLVEELAQRDVARPTLYVETGERFRDFLTGNSFSSQLSREIYEHGELQPEFLAVHMWAHELIGKLNGLEHLVLDGTPRKEREALVLDSAFAFYKRKMPTIIHIAVSNEWSRERMRERKRSDDINENEISKRLSWFETDVQPAINWYRTAPGYRFVELNGERPIEDIHADVMQTIFGDGANDANENAE